MDTFDYIINIALVAVVLRQIQERRVELRDLVRPLAIIAFAATHYLHAIPSAGNDVELIAACVLLGVTFGGLCAAFTHVRRGADGEALARAGAVAAAFWIVGIGARMGFVYAANHGAGSAITRFSAAHHITGASAWTAALVLMAIAEATTRLAVLHLRARRVAAGTEYIPAPRMTAA